MTGQVYVISIHVILFIQLQEFDHIFSTIEDFANNLR